MSKTFYNSQPDIAFWYRSVAKRSIEDIDPISCPSFKISQKTRVATAGSCFAQHIAKHLHGIGIPIFITEKAHPLVQNISEDFHYGIYPARFGNIYTSRQLLQLFLRSYGLFHPAEDIWLAKDGRYYDPFRPSIPGGFATQEEYFADRKRHFSAVREMFEQLDVFIFTLGLTETWRSTQDNAVFPSCPGAIAGEYNPQHHEFLNLTVTDICNDMSVFIKSLRHINPNAKIILTVSPVSLVATATKQHVLSATIFSKSVLRVAAQYIADLFENVDYFPSYEIIAGPQSKGGFFTDDFRTVTTGGVSHVMDIFFKHYTEHTQGEKESPPCRNKLDSYLSSLQEAVDLICEEIYNDSTWHTDRDNP